MPHPRSRCDAPRGIVRTSAGRDVASQVKGWKPDFILTVGDNNYPKGAASTIDRNIGQYYHDFIYPCRGRYGAGAAINRFFPTLGNHRWRARAESAGSESRRARPRGKETSSESASLGVAYLTISTEQSLSETMAWVVLPQSRSWRAECP
jgi:hypothetical protein